MDGSRRCAEETVRFHTIYTFRVFFCFLLFLSFFIGDELESALLCFCLLYI